MTITNTAFLDFEPAIDGGRGMAEIAGNFPKLVAACLVRFAAQNEQDLDEARAYEIGRRLLAVVRERGLPRPLSAAEVGEAGGMDDADCAAIVANVTEAAPTWLADGVRQLVKACFHPEFKVCRNSYREVSSDGSCRRQELSRAMRRASGSHCVDCPYWVQLESDQHAAFLATQWRGGTEAFFARRNVYLPEDFRAVRRWLYNAARASVDT